MIRSTIKTILRALNPTPTPRKVVIWLLVIAAVISGSIDTAVVGLNEYEVKDRRNIAPPSELVEDVEDAAEYASRLNARLTELSDVSLTGLKDHISNTQTQRSNVILAVLIVLAFSGLLLLFSPLALFRRYPGRKLILTRFGFLSASLFILVGLLFVFMYAVTRLVQQLVSTASNPQLSLTESTFNFLIKNSDELARVGPGIIEPALRAVEGDPSAPPLEQILTNAYAFTGEVEMYKSLIGIIKVSSGVASLIPVILLLVAFVVVVRNALPTMRDITRLPAHAAKGIERAGRTCMRNTVMSLRREFIYASILILVLLVVTWIISATGTAAIEPAMQVLLNYLIASFVYLQLAEQAQPGLVFFGILATVSYLAVGLALPVAVASVFLFKASRLLRRSTIDGFRSTRQRRFWLFGIGGLFWLMLFPVIYSQVAGNIVSRLIQLGVDYNAWQFIFVSPPIAMLLMFILSLWAVNGFKTIAFIWRFTPAEVDRLGVGDSDEQSVEDLAESEVRVIRIELDDEPTGRATQN